MRPSGFSDDGYWWWDGASWRPAFSPDYRWRWDGRAWIPAGPLPSARSGMPLGAVIGIVAGISAAVLIIVSIGVFAVLNSRTTNSPPAAVTQPGPSAQASTNTIPCDQLEHTQVHYHAALQILYQGSEVSIPTNVGRTTSCFYWLHMHTGESGLIHIEAPDDRAFTLGDFFAVWSAWGGKMQPLDSTHVSSFTLAPNQTLVVYVDGGSGDGPHLFSGDPSTIVLRSHEVITLEITPPAIDPPPAYAFTPGF